MCDIVICDDEYAVAKQLKEEIESLAIENVHKISIYTDGRVMGDDYQEGTLSGDIVIMDIKIGKVNGITLSTKLLEINPGVQIIFASGYDDYYEEVYDVEHVYFMKKPVSLDILKKAINKALINRARLKEDCFVIENKSGTYLIPFDDICFIEKDRRKILISTVKGETHSLYGKFADIECQLKRNFVRCHYSYIVNFAKVRATERSVFIMRDGRRIPMSRSYERETKIAFARYINGEG